MRQSNQPAIPPGESITFFNGFLKHPQQVGSIIPSSRFLRQRIVELADVASARCLVELGPGTGGTTRAILQAMRHDAKLLVIEINPDFLPTLQRIQDPRMILHNGNAQDLTATIKTYQLPSPDVVISGIPFSTMPIETGHRIVEAIAQALASGGRFVAYQFRDRIEYLGGRVFGQAHVELELLNLPPIRLYRWQKHSHTTPDQSAV